MKLSMILQVAYDYRHSKRYGLRAYTLHDGKKHPFALICPGGGYEMVCSFIEGVPYAKALNRLGYSAFVLYYRCGKKAKQPAPLDDLARAVRDILSRAEELDLDTEGYSVWGSSAGGHLAATFGTEKLGYAHDGLPKPAALVLTYPVVTMEQECVHVRSRRGLLGERRMRDALMRDSLSLEKHVKADTPPVFLLNCVDDPIVDYRNSNLLDSALTANKVPHLFVQYKIGGHGFGADPEKFSEETKQWQATFLQWFYDLILKKNDE